MLPTLRGERVVLRPLAEADLERLAAVITAPGVAEWWGPVEDAVAELRDDEPAFAIEVGGELAGWLGVYEETDPKYRHASLDIVLAPAFQDRGVGSEALRVVARWLLGERGHHRLTIDPAVANERAIRCYRAVGFRPVGVMRRYELGLDGRRHDNLLMDMLAEELRGT